MPCPCQIAGYRTAPKAGKVTLSEYAEAWLSGRCDLRPVTRSKYEHMLRRDVLLVLGGHELARLSPSEVRSWYMAMREKYMTTADDAYRMLRAILSTAVTDGLIVKSPCQVKGAGAARSLERPVLSVEELGAVVEEVANNHESGFEPIRYGLRDQGRFQRLARLIYGVVRSSTWLCPAFLEAVPEVVEPVIQLGHFELPATTHGWGSYGGEGNRLCAMEK